MNRETVLKHTTSFQENLLKALADPIEAQGYLEAAVADYGEDNNIDALLLAIQDVVQAQGSVEQFFEAPLPISGDHLDLKTQILSALSNAAKIARDSSREFLNVTLNFAEGFKTEAPIIPLIEILGGIQKVINRIRMEMINANRITELIKQETGISLVDVSPGSFDILLVSTRNVDLYSDSDFGNALGNALDEFMKLLNAGSNQYELKKLLEQLRSKVAEDYTELLKSLSRSVTDTRFKWTSPNRERGRTVSLSKPQMQEAIEILKRFQEGSPSTFTITGTLTGVWLSSSQRFAIETTERTYTGKIADQVFETVSKPRVNQEYTAEIQEITERSETTAETKTKYELLSLKIPTP